MRIDLTLSTQAVDELLLTTKHLDAFVEAGYDHLEIFLADGHFPWRDRAWRDCMVREIHAREMVVETVHAPWAPEPDIDISSADERMRAASCDELACIIDWAAGIPARGLVIHPGVKMSSGADPKRLLGQSARSLDQLLHGLSDNRFWLALENPPPYELAGDPEVFLRHLKQLAHPNLGWCFDTGHANMTTGLDMLARAEAPLRAVHVSDNDSSADSHWPPGDGSFSWSRLRDHLTERNFEGPAVVELVYSTEWRNMIDRGRAWFRTFEPTSYS